MAGASLGGMKGMHKQGGLPIPDIHHIAPPYHFGDGGEMDPEEYGLLAARRLEEKILQLGPENVAAFIGEPIMGRSGSTSRRAVTGRKSSASAGATTCCWSPTK